MKNKILIIGCIFIVIVNIAICSFAYEKSENIKIAETTSIKDIIKQGQDFISKGESQQDDTIKMDEFNENISFLYTLGVGIGAVIAIIVGIILGIKFMMSASSSEEQAKYKKALVCYFVGCVVIFGAFGIWKIIVNTLTTSIK